MSDAVAASAGTSAPQPKNARERLLTAAYELFSSQGIRAVGIDAVIARSGVARMTLYRHFRSKNDLVLAFLERRERLWTDAWLRAEIERRTPHPRERLLAIFDVFDEWFHSDRFEGCSFINVMLETTDTRNPVHEASVRGLRNIRRLLEQLAAEAGVAGHEDFACKWHILMKGSIVAAAEGDREAARRAREIGRTLLEEALPPQ